jgi:glycosyltransferase involved in cell wall biosynthesis
VRVGIATVQVPFVRGGAEMLAESLREAIRAVGHEAEILSVPFKWYPAARIPEHMLACRLLEVEESCGVPIDRLIGLKFPAYLMRHPSKVLWLLHQYRSAYDTWDGPLGDLINAPDGAHIREVIRSADRNLLRECRGAYTISRNVSDRLRRFCGIDSAPLYHPPPGAERLTCRGHEDFFLFPSRVNESKRQELAVEALLRARHPVRICFIGGVDAPDYAARLRARCAESGLGDRAVWRGAVPDAERIDLYARCLAVVFPPLDEDYCYVTLEAMLSSKAVVTCSDSGGPLEFVLDGETGVVCPPDPDALARALDALWEDRALARRMGEAARARYDAMPIGWDRVLECLLG